MLLKYVFIFSQNNGNLAGILRENYDILYLFFNILLLLVYFKYCDKYRKEYGIHVSSLVLNLRVLTSFCI
jgi:hypothetical protein